MANRRVLVKRRNAARNIRKITRTMQLIATTRFQVAHRRAVASRPYIDKLAELASHLADSGEGLSHPLLEVPEDDTRSVLLVMTSTRGLCGAYNANVLRTASAHLAARDDSGAETEVQVVGKKGITYFKYREREMAQEFPDFGEQVSFDDVEPLANDLMARFVSGEITSVSVVYMKFLSAGKQEPVIEQLLPLSAEHDEEEAAHEAGPSHDYEFSPEPALILDKLLPATVRIRLFQAFTDAGVSEQVARMVAMTAATDAAEDMIKALTRQYNRARQTHITMELLDIVGGAEALG